MSFGSPAIGGSIRASLRYDHGMRSFARVAMSGILFALVTSCAATGQQVQSSMHATCADSCKNQPADTQGECIARCTK